MAKILTTARLWWISVNNDLNDIGGRRAAQSCELEDAASFARMSRNHMSNLLFKYDVLRTGAIRWQAADFSPERAEIPVGVRRNSGG
jgi:hypothetical protein